MQLDGPLDTRSLSTIGAEALALLCSGNITALAARFGYALAYDRELETAIHEDLSSCLAQLEATALLPSPHSAPQVRYFEPNSIRLLAAIECLAPADNGTKVQMVLIVAGLESDRHIYLEDFTPVLASMDGEEAPT